jgi:TetR/AcrR family transcriptional repressor of nem operon
MKPALTHKERTRARILEEAAKAMLIHGTDGLGVAALMRRAGLTHGGFYAHFASREDLVSHAVERMFARSESFIARRLKGKAPGEGLAEMIEGYLSDRARLSPDFACPIPSISGEARRLPEAARARLSAGVRHVEAIIAESLRAMGRDQAEDLAQSVLPRWWEPWCWPARLTIHRGPLPRWPPPARGSGRGWASDPSRSGAPAGGGRPRSALFRQELPRVRQEALRVLEMCAMPGIGPAHGGLSHARGGGLTGKRR